MNKYRHMVGNNLYIGGEVPQIYDIVECRDNYGYEDVVLGCHYAVKKISCDFITIINEGMYPARFTLIKRGEKPKMRVIRD